MKLFTVLGSAFLGAAYLVATAAAQDEPPNLSPLPSLLTAVPPLLAPPMLEVATAARAAPGDNIRQRD